LKVLTAVVGVVALMGGATAHAADRVALSAKVAICTTGADPDARAAAFTGSMPATASSRRMQMRFQLQQRIGSSTRAPFRKVAVPGWSAWVTSDPGRQGFVFTKRVEALSAPAAYRAAVTFRWLDARGHAQKTATRTTAACEEPDPRADLVLASLPGRARGAIDGLAVGRAVRARLDDHGHARRRRDRRRERRGRRHDPASLPVGIAQRPRTAEAAVPDGRVTLH
jgi:hypothetical protein